LRKLAAAGAGNVLSRALGRIERTLFTPQWLPDPALRQRSHAGLNKGEASTALRRAVFFHRQGMAMFAVIVRRLLHSAPAYHLPP